MDWQCIKELIGDQNQRAFRNVFEVITKFWGQRSICEGFCLNVAQPGAHFDQRQLRRLDEIRAQGRCAQQVGHQGAAAGAEFVSRDEVPAERVQAEREVQKARVLEEGKPEHIADKIVDGRMGKFFEDICLLEQKFIKDDKKSIEQILQDAISTIGENIKVRRFARFVLGEGLEKKKDDFAAEVAAAVGG